VILSPWLPHPEPAGRPANLLAPAESPAGVFSKQTGGNMKIKRVKAIFGTRKVIQWQVVTPYYHDTIALFFDRWIDAWRWLHGKIAMLDGSGKAMIR
jgi:hypothetical protein